MRAFPNARRLSESPHIRARVLHRRNAL